MDQKKSWGTAQDACDILGISVPTLYNWQKGGLRIAKKGQKWSLSHVRRLNEVGQEQYMAEYLAALTPIAQEVTVTSSSV
tara:strand:+ start:6440 stop:6679 length:240 start_codon:yes stop_codon:yes gene_type:complete